MCVRVVFVVVFAFCVCEFFVASYHCSFLLRMCVCMCAYVCERQRGGMSLRVMKQGGLEVRQLGETVVCLPAA